MKAIVQTPETISIFVDKLTYVDTMENFALDSGYVMEKTVQDSTRQYEQDVRHCFTDGKNIIQGGPVPWEDGDAILADIERLLLAQHDRLEVLKAEQKRLYDEAVAKQKEMTDGN
jgi:hypothetical protein